MSMPVYTAYYICIRYHCILIALNV